MSIYLINNIIVPLEEEADFRREALRALRCKGSDLLKVDIYRKSVDARKKENIRLNYTIAATLKEGVTLRENAKYRLLMEDKPQFRPGMEPMKHRPVIIGLGPAGMFCGLMLTRAGYQPVILEQGAPMEERVADVEAFWQEQRLDESSNIQFGEGGAGTFSDGKLMTRINDGFCRVVLDEFVAHGAPKEILTAAKPHIGTDLLRKVVVAIRQEIVSLGGEVRFHAAAEDIIAKDGKITGVIAQGEEIPCDCLILAPGNAARPLFTCSMERGIAIEAKPFSVGARIEHPQEAIDHAMYGDYAGHPKLGHAEYQLSERETDTGRAVYTFCMCPGGVVVPAASEEGRVVTNGMSYYARDRENANSALLVGVGPEDFGSDHPLSGMYWQRRLEENAFRAGGSTYAAPAQRVEDLLKGRPSAKGGEVVPSYARGVVWGGFEHVLPAFVTETLRLSIAEMDRKLHGFNFPDAVMTGVETRSSSPIRILRGDSLQSPLTGLYPCGEGAGYAGGIVSAAADGIRVALAVLQKHAE